MNTLAVVDGGCNPPVASAFVGAGALADVARELTRQSADEMVAAAGLAKAPGPVRAAARAAFGVLSRKLGATLAAFDADVGNVGLSIGAARALRRFGARLELRGEAVGTGSPIADGPLLVVANHPGAYDALALMTALRRTRDDLAIVAGERVFLRALPHVAERLIFVGADPAASASGVRRAFAHLKRGGALLQFGAGRIEPDAQFDAGEPLAAWTPGTGALVRVAARAGARVVVATTAGVHSARAKKAAIVRFAEARGVTTLAPLLQIAVPGFGDVRVVLTLGEARSAKALTETSTDERALADELRSVATRQLDDLVVGRRA